jgi:hypothetical protein
MSTPTTTITPDELLGLDELLALNAIAKLETVANGGEADVMSTAKSLMQGALAAKLDELGLPWAPEPTDVRKRAAEIAQADDGQRRLARNERLKRFALSFVMAAALVALWGGYVRGWQWTGFQQNEQLWDWLHLLLLPVVVGTIPLWIQHGRYVSRPRRAIYGAIIAVLALFVAAGYLIPLKWTGFQGNTLWNWYGLILLPVAVTTLIAWPSAGRPLRPYHKGGIFILVLGWVITVVGGYALRWSWTGYQGNTLWNWLQLLLLPLVVPTFLLPAVTKWFKGNAAQRAQEAQEAARKAPSPPARQATGTR